jgi:preprotein translocase subunit SecG
MSFLFWIALVLFIIVCLFMILLVLIQKGRGGGLASAFGGMGGNTAFGSKTGDVLTWATSIVFGIFIVLAISLNLLANYRQNQANRAAAAQPAPAIEGSTFPAVPPGPGPAPAPEPADKK